MVTPTGGKKDVSPPKLLNLVKSVQKGNGQLEKVYFLFNEHIGFNQWEEHFYISPPINKPIEKKITNKYLELHIEDTLKENTTYLLSLNHCIKDINEANILENLQLLFSTSENMDSLKLNGRLQDSYTLAAIENAWIMLFEKERNDSVIFKDIPNYIAKTNKDGFFSFPNLNNKHYRVVALTGFDFSYNKEEAIAFHNNLINAEQDSFVTLFSFDPIVKIDSLLADTTTLISDITIATDTILKEEIVYGNLKIVTPKNSPSIFQLLQNEKIIIEFVFTGTPYILTNIVPGKYQLKYITDTNEDGIWNCGSWQAKTQSEKVINYPTEITIRSNWDLEVEWNLE